MKNLFIIFIISSISLFSQLQDFTVREGYARAKELIAGKVTNPKLVATGSFNNLAVSDLLTIKYDNETGKTNMVLYFFTDSSDESIIEFVAIIKVFNFFSDASSLAPGLEEQVPWDDIPRTIIENENWIDTDALSQKIKDNADFQFLKTVYPKAQVDLVGLGVNEEPGTVSFGEVFWLTQFKDSETLEFPIICTTDAYTGTTECFDNTINSVKFDKISHLEFSPNPANDNIYIELENIKNIRNIQVFDIFGKEYNVEYNLISNRLKLDIKNFDTGTYFVKILNDKSVYGLKFIKN